jgi:hypothetical protein
MPLDGVETPDEGVVLPSDSYDIDDPGLPVVEGAASRAPLLPRIIEDVVVPAADEPDDAESDNGVSDLEDPDGPGSDGYESDVAVVVE